MEANEFNLYSNHLKDALSDSEQQKYIELAYQGDYEAQQKLFEHNMRLVLKVINENFYNLNDSDKEDIFQVGCIGLWEAIQKYNPSFDTKLSTYASKVIFGEIKNHFRYSNLLHIPSTIQELAKKVYKLLSEYEKKEKTLNEKELATLLNVSEKEIVLALKSKQNISIFSKPLSKEEDDTKLEDTIQDLSVNIEEEIEQKEFINEINNSIDKLDNISKIIIKLLYGIGCKSKTQIEIAKKLKMSKRQFTNYKNEAILKLKQLILENKKIDDKPEMFEKPFKQRKKMEFKPKKPQMLFSEFPGHTEEEILKAVNMLNNENKKITELYYGLNGNKSISNTEIEKIVGIKEKNIRGRIYTIKKQILNILKNGIPKEETIYDLYPEYSQEQILGAIDSLKPKNKRIVELKYGLNGNEFTETKDIAEYFNTTVAIINSLYWTIHEQIKRRLEKGQFKRETIFDLYPEYSQEQILGVISTLNEENRNIIELRYGLNGKGFTEVKDIAKKLNGTHRLVHNILWTTRRQMKRRLEKGQFRKETIFDLYPEYTQEQVLSVINTLKKENKTIIELRYGLNGNKAISNNELEEQFNVHRADARVYSIINQIKEKLEKGQFQQKTIYDLYPEYSQEQILGAIDTLKPKNKRIIELRYGLNENEFTETKDIAEYFNTTIAVIDNRITAIRRQIERRLNKYNIKINKDIEIIDCSSELENYKSIDLKKDKENIKKLISMIDNPIEKEALLLRLGCIHDKYYTEEEIAKILNINENNVNAIIKDGLSKISTLSVQNQKV